MEDVDADSEADVSWREYGRKLEEFLASLEDFLATSFCGPASFAAELRACCLRVRQQWERENELRRCDSAWLHVQRPR